VPPARPSAGCANSRSGPAHLPELTQPGEDGPWLRGSTPSR
jgi:hypothetical protein